MKLRTKVNFTGAELLYAWRRRERLSQADLAARSGFHQTAISKMERGEIPVHASLKPEIRKREIPDWIVVGVVRRRLKISLATVRKKTGIAAHILSDIERGRLDIPEAYTAFLEKSIAVAKS